MNRLGNLFLCIALMSAMNVTTVFASEASSNIAQNEKNSIVLTDEAVTENNDKLMQDFIAYITFFFEDPETNRAIDFNGNDISEDFYSANIDLYSEGEYEQLRQSAYKNIAYLSACETVPEFSQTESIVPYVVSSRSFSDWVGFTTVYPKFEFQIGVSASYKVDTQLKQVLEINNSAVWLEYYSAQTQGDCLLRNIRKVETMTANNSRARVSFSCTVVRMWGIIEYDAGYYEGWIEGDVNGNTYKSN